LYLPNKKLLVLDLDYTLVCSSFNPINIYDNGIRKQNKVTAKFDNETDSTIYFIIRPGLDEFLQSTSLLYDIIIFTASLKQYASPIIDFIDKNNIIKFLFYREDCRLIDGKFIKDLKILGKDLKDVIIVDDNVYSFLLNENNGIVIRPWMGDIGDIELIKLIPLLEFLAKKDDVREIIKELINNKGEINHDKFDIIFNKERNH
jgi:RNA polymerase II subunit A small phosphatase-like protein